METRFVHLRGKGGEACLALTPAAARPPSPPCLTSHIDPSKGQLGARCSPPSESHPQCSRCRLPLDPKASFTPHPLSGPAFLPCPIITRTRTSPHHSLAVPNPASRQPPTSTLSLAFPTSSRPLLSSPSIVQRVDPLLHILLLSLHVTAASDSRHLPPGHGHSPHGRRTQSVS